MHGRDDRSGRSPAIRMARPATVAEARLIRSELAGLFGVALRLRKPPAKRRDAEIAEGAATVTAADPARRGLTLTIRPARPAFRAKPVASGSAGRCERALAAAVAAFGGRGGRAFLNGHHRGLNGPPIELAAASGSGLRVVEAAIAIDGRRRAEGRAR